MTIREKLQEQLGILSKEKERRKMKRLSTSGGELNLNQVGDQFIGGNSVFAQNEDFRQQVEENAKQAMATAEEKDPTELDLNQVGDQFIGGNSVFAQDEDFRHQVEENAMKAMSGENPTQR